MFDEFTKKKAVFLSYKPFSKDFMSIYDDLNCLDFAYMNLKLDGSSMTREGVNQIMRGGVIDDIPLMEHQEIECHRLLLRTFSDMAEMDMELDETQLKRLYKVLTGKDDAQLRRSAITLYHLDYVPPKPHEIEEALRGIFMEVFKTDFQGDFIRKAVFIHNKIIEVYPFKNKNEALARTAMEYELIRNDMPVVAYKLTEPQYNSILSEYLKTGDYDPLLENILHSAVIKLDSLIKMIRVSKAHNSGCG